MYNSQVELANHSTRTFQTRLASPNDVGAMTSLLQQAKFLHFHADWQLPIDWIGQPVFLVAEPQTPPKTNPFTGHKTRLEGCLAIVGSPPPVAWVRVVGIRQTLTTLELLMAKIEPQLQQAGISTIGWLPSDEWVSQWVTNIGFHQSTELETYVKMDLHHSIEQRQSPLHIRSATPQDIPALEQLEIASFDPLWRYDTQSLHYALDEAYRFEVAMLEDSIIGYMIVTELPRKVVHLARLAIAPQYQGKGFASALLSYTLRQCQKEGVQNVSLNTQTNNQASQRLYKRFGFQPTGHRVPVWVKELSSIT